MKALFATLIFNPLYNALVLLFLFIPDLGVAIVLLTVAIRFALLPIARKSIESQKAMQEIQPEIKEIQNKYKNDKQLQGQKMMELYKEKKINPASGCLPLVVQLVFLIALYRVFMIVIGKPADEQILYSFVQNPGMLDPISLGFFDLSEPNIPLAVIAAGLQFVQSKMLIKKQPVKKQEKSKKTDEPDFSSIM
jgi:YidC/Oxa1 family membrane protein insertase